MDPEKIILKFLNVNLKVNSAISEIYCVFRLGKRDGSNHRPVIIKFITLRQVSVQRKGKQIHMNEDLPKEVIEKIRTVTSNFEEI